MKRKMLTEAGHAHVRDTLIRAFSVWIDNMLEEDPMYLGTEATIEFTAHFHIGRNANPERPDINWVSDSPDYVQ